MLKKQKLRMIGIVTFLLMFVITPVSYGMHIMEGYLTPRYCVAWGLAVLPFIIWGLKCIKKILEKDRKNITLLAMAGAFIFVISSLKIPSVTGSCSHMTGTGLGAILFGPAPVVILGLIVLLFQAILLAHGGITTLGANTFSMAIAGPIFAFGIYKLCKKCGVNKKAGAFLAAFLGDLFTYCVTSFQLAAAYPSAEGGIAASAVKFLSIFAPTQFPLAILEGILTVIIVITLETYAVPEMKLIGFFGEENKHEQK